MHYDRASFTALEASFPHVAGYISKQLFDPATSFQWVVVPTDFEADKARVAEAT
ncbi:unnamed protein product, partial [Phaeothamnion confervicola]